nr:MAG TPA: hypothetical protein [Caudoviricetes sp.]
MSFAPLYQYTLCIWSTCMSFNSSVQPQYAQRPPYFS